MKQPTIGQRVTSTAPKEAYYSNYGGNPSCFFVPGDIGVVAAVKVPAVRAPFELVPYTDPYNGSLQFKKTYPRGRNPTFNCVDFIKDGRMWRVHFYNDELTPAPEFILHTGDQP
jgi:hypothetical protein